MNARVKTILDGEGCYSREDPSVVARTLSELGISAPASFVEFYEKYKGGFSSDHTGFMLLDLVGDSHHTIAGATQICREVHGFRPEHLVISDLVGDGLLVYDCMVDRVYNVDFEGGNERLKNDKLSPTWTSFEDFLNSYFLGDDWSGETGAIDGSQLVTNIEDVIKFLRQYHHPLLEADPPRPLPRPDIFIPEPLSQMYDAFGHHIIGSWGPLSAQDVLLAPSELRLMGKEVTFLRENQNCWTCAYDQELPGHAVRRHDLECDGVTQDATLGEILITFALQEAVMSSPWLLAVDGVSSVDELGFELVDLHRNGSYVFDGPSHSFWISPKHDVICMDALGSGLWLASYSQDLLAVRRPHLEYQIVSPRDPMAPQTFIGRVDSGHPQVPSRLHRLIRWLRPRRGPPRN